MRSAIVAVLFSVAGVVGLGGGCATHDDTPPFDGSLHYDSTGGSLMTHTSVLIDAAGNMTWVKTDGSTTTAMLPAATLADLRNNVDQAEFLTLEPVYSCGCHPGVVQRIRVEIAGTSHVVVVEGSANIPARLQPLVDMLWDMTQTARSRD
jgi:hypothetical protein